MEPYVIALGGFIAGIACLVSACALIRGGQAVAQPLTFEPHEDRIHIQPFIRLEIETAQNLMDELWQCGLRPTEGTGSAGSLKATERHLEDMRTIAFKKLNIGNGD